MGRKTIKLAAPKQIPSRKRVAAYARVSNGKNEMLNSLAAQVSAYSTLIQSRADWEYAGVYADEAATGTKASRPEFQRLLRDCRTGLIDMIVTKSISRFARNTVTVLEVVRELKELGVNVYFERENINTDSADGELMLSILASYAQEESRSASENVKWKIRKKYKEGKPAGYMSVYGYDYSHGKLKMIPEEAKVVQMIYNDYLAGLGFNAIAKKLKRLKVPTKLGGEWGESTLRFILQNEKYLGDLLLQKSYVEDHLGKRRKKNEGELPKYYVENNHPAIIDRETFDAVQAERSRRVAAIDEPEKINFSEFTHKIKCGKCGANFWRRTYNGGTKNEKRLWSCATYSNKGKALCDAKRIPEKILKAKCAEALALKSYNSEIFKEKIRTIQIPSDGFLVFVFKDGEKRTLTWENLSRRDSWTDEMRQAAREQPLKGVN